MKHENITAILIGGPHDGETWELEEFCPEIIVPVSQRPLCSVVESLATSKIEQAFIKIHRYRHKRWYGEHGTKEVYVSEDLSNMRAFDVLVRNFGLSAMEKARLCN